MEQPDNEDFPLERAPWMATAVKIFRVLSILMVLAVVSIFVLLVRAERAHDEARCPFQEIAERRLPDGVAVVEEQRRCMDDAQEHRWMVQRPGKQPVELARRRLSPELFAEGAYSWKLSLEDDGGVILELENRGFDTRSYLESDLLTYVSPDGSPRKDPRAPR